MCSASVTQVRRRYTQKYNIDVSAYPCVQQKFVSVPSPQLSLSSLTVLSQLSAKYHTALSFKTLTILTSLHIVVV